MEGKVIELPKKFQRGAVVMRSATIIVGWHGRWPPSPPGPKDRLPIQSLPHRVTHEMRATCPGRVLITRPLDYGHKS
jgi:hypothetical protein